MFVRFLLSHLFSAMRFLTRLLTETNKLAVEILLKMTELSEAKSA